VFCGDCRRFYSAFFVFCGDCNSNDYYYSALCMLPFAGLYLPFTGLCSVFFLGVAKKKGEQGGRMGCLPEKKMEEKMLAMKMKINFFIDESLKASVVVRNFHDVLKDEKAFPGTLESLREPSVAQVIKQAINECWHLSYADYTVSDDSVILVFDCIDDAVDIGKISDCLTTLITGVRAELDKMAAKVQTYGDLLAEQVKAKLPGIEIEIVGQQ